MKLKVHDIVLLHNDEHVVTLSLKDALLGMLEWMKSLTNNKSIMCGHYSKGFDCVHFIYALVLTKVDITEFPQGFFTDFLQTDYA